MRQKLSLIAVFTAFCLVSCGHFDVSVSDTTPSTDLSSSSFSSEMTSSSSESSSELSESSNTIVSSSSEQIDSSSESSVISSESTEQSTSSESSLQSSVSSSSEPEIQKPSILETLYGTSEAFESNYLTLVNKKANSISYYTKSSSLTYDKPTKITFTVDEDEYLKYMVPKDDDGNDLEPEYDYYKLTDTEYYRVRFDNTIYSDAARYKIGTPNGIATDVITAEEAKKKFDADMASSGNTVAKAVRTVDLQTLREGSVVTSYSFDEDDDGHAFIEYKSVYNGNYFGSIYRIELDMNEKGDIIEGYFKKENYLNAAWDKTNAKPQEGAQPNSWFSSSISNVNYSGIENTDLFDASKHFAQSATGITFHYYQADMETGISTERSEAYVGETFVMKNFDFDKVLVTPSTAVDLDTLYITDSNDRTVIDLVEESSIHYWKAIGVGTSVVTLGNSFKSDIAKVTINVTEPNA